MHERFDKSKLTAHDRELVRQAEAVSYIYWEIPYNLAEQADTVQGYEALINIGSYKRHLEEAKCDMI